MPNVGMPILKGCSSQNMSSSKNKGQQSSRKGSQRGWLFESFEERCSSDPDLDRSKTNSNKYWGISRKAGEIDQAIIDEVESYREEYIPKTGKHAGQKMTRKARTDGSYSFMGIVKPEADFINALTPEQREQFWEDTMNILFYDENAIFGRNGRTGKENLRAAVLHRDEYAEHLHFIGIPYTEDGRFCPSDFFSLKAYNRLNKEYPERMRAKGWQIENLTVYDADKVNELKAAAADAEKQGDTQTAEQKKQEIEDYKTEVKEKRSKHRHNTTKAEYLKQKNAQLEQANRELQQKVKQQQRQIEEENQALQARKNAVEQREQQAEEYISSEVERRLYAFSEALQDDVVTALQQLPRTPYTQKIEQFATKEPQAAKQAIRSSARYQSAMSDMQQREYWEQLRQQQDGNKNPNFPR